MLVWRGLQQSPSVVCRCPPTPEGGEWEQRGGKGKPQSGSGNHEKIIDIPFLPIEEAYVMNGCLGDGDGDGDEEEAWRGGGAGSVLMGV